MPSTRCWARRQRAQIGMLNNGCVHVMVVDDHLGIRRAVSSLIDAEMPRMRCVGDAATPREALARAAELQPDVIVLDINLDGEDGLLLIPALQGCANCAVVVLTGITDPHVTALAQRRGAYQCLNKTAPAAELLAAILLACRSRRLTQATPIRGGNIVPGVPGPLAQDG
jgi:two-component system, NarL family, nitrate/nitrite response regulator NarL